MDFAFDAATEELRAKLLDFMESHVYPAEHAFHEQQAELADPWAWDSIPVLGERLDRRARQRVVGGEQPPQRPGTVEARVGEHGESAVQALERLAV